MYYLTKLIYIMQFRNFKNYSVDAQGTILNTKRNKELNPTLDGSGYPQVKLYKDGIGYQFHVHKVVYVAFNGEVPQGYEIDHINGIKTDNRLENLRCLTHKENVYNPITFEKFLKSMKTEEFLKKHRENSEKMRGKPLSDETKRKMSEAHKGKCPPQYVLEAAKQVRQRRVYQYTLDGELVREYYPLKSVEEHGFNYKCVIRCCNGQRKTYKGFKWSYTPLPSQ